MKRNMTSTAHVASIEKEKKRERKRNHVCTHKCTHEYTCPHEYILFESYYSVEILMRMTDPERATKIIQPDFLSLKREKKKIEKKENERDGISPSFLGGQCDLIDVGG